MSMISSQCDNLRLMARLVREYDYSEISTALRDAADTIWELRNDCVELRGDRDFWRVEQTHAFGNWEDAYNRAKELEDENEKLSDLVFDLYCDLNESNPSIYNKYSSRMRELRIEVDE